MIKGAKERWEPWQLAPDETTYGKDAGRWVIVTEDGEHELPFGVMEEVDAIAVVQAHNALLFWATIEQILFGEGY